MIRRLESFKPREVAAESMVATKADYLLWQEEQLFAGMNKKGKKIKPPYASSTKRIKNKKGQPTDRVTLKDTGKYYSSIFLVVIKGSGIYRTTSSDVKSKWLVEKYGENILGLGGVFKKGYINDLRPIWQTKVESVLKLKFGN
jgi:hypothetical protein